MMTTITETTSTGKVRAAVSSARDNGVPVDRLLALGLLIADFLELPDDTQFLPAVEAAMQMRTQIDDHASKARTREVALAAGYGEKRPPTSGLAKVQARKSGHGKRGRIFRTSSIVPLSVGEASSRRAFSYQCGQCAELRRAGVGQLISVAPAPYQGGHGLRSWEREHEPRRSVEKDAMTAMAKEPKASPTKVAYQGPTSRPCHKKKPQAVYPLGASRGVAST